MLLVTLMLTSKGVAGVFARGHRHLLGTVGSFGLPTVAGVHPARNRSTDGYGRTAINVLGNCLATVVVARWEGDFEKEKPSPDVMSALSG